MSKCSLGPTVEQQKKAHDRLMKRARKIKVGKMDESTAHACKMIVEIARKDAEIAELREVLKYTQDYLRTYDVCSSYLNGKIYNVLRKYPIAITEK